MNSTLCLCGTGYSARTFPPKDTFVKAINGVSVSLDFLTSQYGGPKTVIRAVESLRTRFRTPEHDGPVAYASSWDGKRGPRPSPLPPCRSSWRRSEFRSSPSQPGLGSGAPGSPVRTAIIGRGRSPLDENACNGARAGSEMRWGIPSLGIPGTDELQ